MLVAAITAAAWAATTWLLSVAGNNASLRVKAIKAGLTVAARTGGAAALLLAAGVSGQPYGATLTGDRFALTRVG